MDYGRLDKNHRVVPVDDITEWTKTYQIENRRVAFTDFGNGITVSTVFLGVDHGFGGPPLWFESMVFGLGGDEEIQERYETWEQAEAGHAKLVKIYGPVAKRYPHKASE